MKKQMIMAVIKKVVCVAGAAVLRYACEKMEQAAFYSQGIDKEL